MSLRQSWPNIAAMAQQSGMDPKNYCERYLWQVATQMGTSMAKTAAGYLAHEQWQRVAQATRETCPTFAENEANGLGSVTAIRKTLDLSTQTVTESKDSKCVAVQ